jgi:hypothetical protein
VFSVLKTGDVSLGEHIYFNNVTNGVSWDAVAATTLDLYTSNVARFRFSNGQLTATAGFTLGATAGAPDVFMVRDAANAFALRNGVNPQKSCVYNTYTDASNYEAVCIDWTTSVNVADIKAFAAGTGTSRPVRIVGPTGAAFGVGEANIGDNFSITTSGNLVAGVDNTYDIGASGANRPRNLYVGSGILAGGGIGAGSTAQIYWSNRAILASPADGVVQIEKAAGNGAQPNVAALPACSAGAAGSRGMVTDATVAASSNFGAVVTGGGSNTVPVYCDGTSWKIGQVANDNLPPALNDAATKLWSTYG